MLNLSNKSVSELIPQDRLYSLRALQSPGAARALARWISGLFFIFLVILFLPWQQNIHGNGVVTALSPANRPQVVPALISGRIESWKVQEGQYVHLGDTIAVLSEIKEKYFDPNFLKRMQEQIEAKTNSLESKKKKADALENQLKAIRQTLSSKTEQLKSKLVAEEIKFQNMQSLYDRNKILFNAGNITLSKFQDTESKYRSSEADFQNAKIELDRTNAEYEDKLFKTASERNNTLAEYYEGVAEVSKMKNEFTNQQIRSTRYHILAPQSGYVVRAMKAGFGETISEGESICNIMPEGKDIAVEMFVKAMDVPLISAGRKVRIQFDGWPALQFSGWPSISVGTFGGTVKVIDYVTSKPGEFRILVVPDASSEPWPAQLRIGSGTKGWVMLDSVRVWFEIWRQLNGFPPSLYNIPAPLDNSKQKKQDGKAK
jgi:multidrug resistance efflux pump